MVWSVIHIGKATAFPCGVSQTKPITIFTMNSTQNRQTLLEQVAPSVVNRSGFRNVGTI
ncbi:MAG: hypothetical protein WBY44_02615 [Bryobacteraceae bacterium]